MRNSKARTAAKLFVKNVWRKMKKTKKRNAADATLRNVRAVNKRIARLEAAFHFLAQEHLEIAAMCGVGYPQGIRIDLFNERAVQPKR